MVRNIAITKREREIVRGVLSPYAEKIDEVAVFGSRAMGTARPASDIDLVIYGDLSEDQISRLWSLFDQSSLAVTVDIADYSRVAHAPLKRHIDAVAIPLFTRADLNA